MDVIFQNPDSIEKKLYNHLHPYFCNTSKAFVIDSKYSIIEENSPVRKSSNLIAKISIAVFTLSLAFIFFKIMQYRMTYAVKLQLPPKMNRPLHNDRVKYIAQNAIKHIKKLNSGLKIDPNRVEQIFHNPENSVDIAQSLYNQITNNVKTRVYLKNSLLCNHFFSSVNNNLNICEYALGKYLSSDGIYKNINHYLRTGLIKQAFQNSRITRMNAQDYKRETAFLAFCIQLYLVKSQVAPEVKNYKSDELSPRTYKGKVTRRVKITDAEEAEEYKSVELENATQFLSTSAYRGSAAFFGNIVKTYTPHGNLAGIIPPNKLVQFKHEYEVLFPISSKLVCR